jgi:hypothetical protein
VGQAWPRDGIVTKEFMRRVYDVSEQLTIYVWLGGGGGSLIGRDPSFSKSQRRGKASRYTK